MPPTVYRAGERPHDPSPPSSSPKFYDAVTNFSDVPSAEEIENSDFAASFPSEAPILPAGKPLHKYDWDLSDDDSDEDGKCPIQHGDGDHSQARQQTRNRIHSLQPAQLMFPRSQYSRSFNEATASFEQIVPPLPIYKERIAVKDLLDEVDRQNAADPIKSRANASYDDCEFTEFDLTDFFVYLPATNTHHAFELRPLDHLASRIGNSFFVFDGVLSIGGVRRYVQGVPFKVCSIGNYGLEHDEVGNNIWIQSDLNAKEDIYYHLKAPAPEYARFHEGFLWLANLAKHVVDYCQSPREPSKSISVHDFRADFSHWVMRTHGASSKFQKWYQQYQRHDFRRAVAQNINFLFKEAVGVDDNLRSHRIWSELMDKTAIRKHEIRELKTVVTPYVYECFSHLRFGKHLKALAPASGADIRRASQGAALHLTVDEVPIEPECIKKMSQPVRQDTLQSFAERALDRQKLIKSVEVGDVLSVVMDGDGSVWKDEVSRWKAADNCWYLLVQGVHLRENGERSFDGIWLYKSSDTTCAKMKYPFPNELFLSDHCTCPMGREEEERIIDVIPVAWHSSPSEAGSNFFIRQTYLDGERFVTLMDAHKRCEHLQQKEKDSMQQEEKYQPGETVLVHTAKVPQRKSKHGLEPYEVLSYVQEGTKRTVMLRRLLRRAELEGQGRCAPNELVYTEQMDKAPAIAIKHGCLIRFYSEADVRSGTIPAPYDRNGTGNAFYITARFVEKDGAKSFLPIKDIPSSFIQGFDPKVPLSRDLLRGMDLYCGGGNFGRGLEEGGAVHHKWAVDLAENAIHTYYANLENPADTKLFFGSVDDLLSQALKGNPRNSLLIPLPGEVDFISAGSPCQGFSLLNSQKNSDRALKNQSLVASVAAYVDFYRPKYGILENVMNMAQKGRGRDEDVLSQLICSIVGMGYQVQVFVVDAWSCGSPQSRSRLFVSFAAPGYEPIEHPKLSHSHPSSVRTAGIGLKSNGETFGQRLFGPTAFEYVTAGESTSDLPRIADGRTFQCTSHPDHIVPRPLKAQEQSRIACIPITPNGMNFVKTWNNGKGTMTKAERELFPNISKKGELRVSVATGSRAWGRVDPNGLFSTIVVQVSAQDARMGTCIHWNQQRLLTVMEGRRAQSFPDDEVLVGSPIEQWKIVGNSVARTVALTLGLALREAWLNSPTHQDQPSVKFKSTFVVILPPAKVVKAPLHTKPRPVCDSSDEADMSDQKYKGSLGLCLSQPTSRDEEAASSGSSVTTDSTGKSSKRPLNEARILPPQKKSKLSGPTAKPVTSSAKTAAPRSASPLGREPSERPATRPMVILPGHRPSAAPTLPPQKPSMARPISPSILSKKLAIVIQQKQLVNVNIGQESGTSSEYEETDDEEADEEAEDAESDDPISWSSSIPARSQLVGGWPVPRKSAKQARKNSSRIINLVSDSEEDAAAELVVKKEKPKKKYVPVDNSLFSAYTQTKRSMKRSR